MLNVFHENLTLRKLFKLSYKSAMLSDGDLISIVSGLIS